MPEVTAAGRTRPRGVGRPCPHLGFALWTLREQICVFSPPVCGARFQQPQDTNGPSLPRHRLFPRDWDNHTAT